MKIISTIAICFILFMVSLIFPSTASAQSYRVQPYILVPQNFEGRITDSVIVQYQNALDGALREVQQFYAQKLNGKTFTLGSQAIVRRSSTSINTLRISNLIDIFNQLGGYNSIQVAENQVNVIWIIGSENIASHILGAGIGFGESGVVLLNEENLSSIRGSATYGRALALNVVAHELGHAFGLVFSGYAKAHPCTTASTHECATNAPRPLPSADEWNRSVMGYGSRDLTAGFNNSAHNPELWKLYQSPFLNPQGDPAPTAFPLPTAVVTPTPLVTPILTPSPTAPLRMPPVLTVTYVNCSGMVGYVHDGRGGEITDYTMNIAYFPPGRPHQTLVHERVATSVFNITFPSLLAQGLNNLVASASKESFGQSFPPQRIQIECDSLGNTVGQPTIASSPTSLPPVISEITSPVHVGEILEIIGLGFGESQGTVTFEHGTSRPIAATQITRWIEPGIRVVVPEGVLSGSVVTVRTQAGASVSSSPITVNRNQPYPEALILEISINGNDDDGQIFIEEEEARILKPWQVSADVPDQVTISGRLYVDQAGSNSEPCVSTNTDIIFRLGNTTIGTAKPCESTTVDFPQDLGSYTISASFPGDGLLASVTDTLTFTVAQAGTQTATPTQVPTPTVSSTSSGGLPTPTGIYTLPGSACNTGANPPPPPCQPGYVCSASQFGFCVAATSGSGSGSGGTSQGVGQTCDPSGIYGGVSGQGNCQTGLLCSSGTRTCYNPTPNTTGAQPCSLSGTSGGQGDCPAGYLCSNATHTCYNPNATNINISPTPTTYVVQVQPNIYLSGCVFFDSNGDGKFNGVDRSIGSNFTYTCLQIEAMGAERGYEGATLSVTGPPGTTCAGGSTQITSGVSGSWSFTMGSVCRSGNPVVELISPVAQTINTFVIHNFRGGTASGVADFAMPASVSFLSPSPTPTPEFPFVVSPSGQTCDASLACTLGFDTQTRTIGQACVNAGGICDNFFATCQCPIVSATPTVPLPTPATPSQISPFATTTPVPTAAATITATPTPTQQAGSSTGGGPSLFAALSGATITVSWSGVSASDFYWLISPSWTSQSAISYRYLANCGTSIPTGPPPPSGSCDFQAPGAPGDYLFRLVHIGVGSSVVATSNTVTVGISGTTGVGTTQPAAPTPTPGQKQLVRISVDGQEVYRPGVNNVLHLDLRSNRVRVLVIEYLDAQGNQQSRTYALTFNRQPTPTLPQGQPTLPPSFTLSAGTPSCPYAGSKPSVTLNWSALLGTTNYDVYRDGALIAPNLFFKTLTFTDTSAPDNTDVSYRVVSRGQSGWQIAAMPDPLVVHTPGCAATYSSPSTIGSPPILQPTVAYQTPAQACSSVDCKPAPAGCSYVGAVTTSCDPNVPATCGTLVCPTPTPAYSTPYGTPSIPTPNPSSNCIYSYKVLSAPSYGCPGPGTMCYDGSKVYCTPG